MYFLHLFTSTVFQNCNCELRLVCWFNLPPDEFLEFMPIGFRSGDSGGVFHQLIPCLSKMLVAALEVCLGSLSCMNLCESISLVNEWDQSHFQNCCVELCIHCPCHNYYRHSTSFVYTGPYVQFYGVLWTWFQCGLLSFFPV